jgi:hypothetical protein
MLHRFDDLLIERYEMVRAVSDFSDRRETEIYRLIARKRLPIRLFAGDRSGMFR